MGNSIGENDPQGAVAETLPGLMPGIPGMLGMDGSVPGWMLRGPGGRPRPLGDGQGLLPALRPMVYQHEVDEGKDEDCPPMMPVGEFGGGRRGST
jgi:hypothetical protein